MVGVGAWTKELGFAGAEGGVKDDESKGVDFGGWSRFIHDE